MKLIKKELNNIRYAIQWETLVIINSLLLNEVKLNEFIEIFESSNMPPMSKEEMLEFSDISIFHNTRTPLYIAKIPHFDKIKYQNILLKPICKNN